MKKLALLFSVLLGATSLMSAEYEIKSPDGKLSAKVADGAILKFSVSADGKKMLEDCAISMSTDKGELGVNAVVKSSKQTSNTGYIDTVYGMKNRVSDNFNQLELDFGKYTLFLRAYDDAVAYRFATRFDGEMIVKNELLDLSSIKPKDKIIAHVVRAIKTSFEELYLRGTADMMKEKNNATLPFIFEKEGMKVAIVESAWFDYPGLRFAWKKGDSNLKAMFTKVPKKLGFRGLKEKGYFVEKGGMYLVKETQDYIAKTKGSRAFPWRAFIVARKDTDLADNDTVFRLAEPQKFADTSWIKLGTSVWDWWVNWNTENVDIPLSFNLDMCKYYIDFASENNIPFVTFDAGWHVGRDHFNSKDKSREQEFILNYVKPENFINGKPRVDIPEAVRYANSKGVKVIIWIFSRVVFDYPEQALDLFKSWGVYGLKIDFNDRDDQWMINHFENITRLAAERQMVIDWHGCPAPAGFQRTYPNAVNFEAVYGGEVNKWSNAISPSHNVDLVFTRMLLGSMDYTSGGMRNKSNGNWVKSNDFPAVQGTRAHMLSHYVLFNEPLKMISDMPSEYLKAPEQLKFMAEVPTSWDETKVLDGKMGEYVVIARRKGDVWYVGAMCDWGGKKFKLDLSKFLPKGKFKAEIFQDGMNSNKIATDCKRIVKEVSSKDVLDIEMKKGGGFAIKLVPLNYWIW